MIQEGLKYQGVRFLIKGPQAHFRNIATNSSSFTYPIPPPTTIAGLIAAAMGYEKETYRKQLNQGLFGIRPLGPSRTIITTMNLLFVKADAPNRTLDGSTIRTQVPTQMLMPAQGEKALGFEIIYAHTEAKYIEDIISALNEPHYQPVLGLAHCLAWFEDIEYIDLEKLDGATTQETYGAIAGKHLLSLSPLPKSHISRERYAIRLGENRKLEESDTLVVDLGGVPLKAQANNLFQITNSLDKRVVSLI